MKISKRFLGIALAIILIFNVFAFGTFAAFPDDTGVKLGLRLENEKTYAPGEEFTLIFSAQSNDVIGKMNASGIWEIAYDSSAISPKANTDALADHGFVLDDSQSSGFFSNFSGVVLPENLDLSTITENSYGWDNIMDITVTVNDCYVDTITNSYDFFKITMKVADDAADGTYTIGYNADGYTTWWQANNSSENFQMGAIGGFSGDEIGADGLAYVYEFGTCEITVSSGPSVVVEHDGTQSKWAQGDAKPYAENYLFGFRGKFTGLELEKGMQDVDGVQRDVITNISSIVAVATINGKTVSSEVETVWLNADGSYGFRAQFGEFDPEDTYTATVGFVITMADGTTTYTTEEDASKTIKAIYEESVGKGLPAVVR